jgi:hypothetical protein
LLELTCMTGATETSAYVRHDDGGSLGIWYWPYAEAWAKEPAGGSSEPLAVPILEW